VIWIAITALILIALGVALPPLLREAPAQSTAAKDLAVYRDQLKEVDADLERGAISATEADAARAEIKRRILALPPIAPTTGVRAGSRQFAVALGLGVSVVSLGLYLALGTPLLPSKPYDPTAEREAAIGAVVNEFEAMAAKLADRLKAEPNNKEGWRVLGLSYLQLGKMDEGIEALARALALDPENATLIAQYGEAKVRAAGGTVTPEAAKIFAEALEHNPKETRALFYRGVGLVQAGKEKEGLDVWIAILREASAESEWVGPLRSEARALAAKLKLDPSVVP
jgi:cytochrome c-type biogenesis protein CcmH